MATGKQYYKYKKHSELLTNLLFDIETLLIYNKQDPKMQIQVLRGLYRKYKDLKEDGQK